MRSTIAVLLLLAVAGWAFAGEPVGSIKNVTGRAAVVRSGQPVPAEAGTLLEQGDLLATGPDGSMGVIFRDDTSLSLGPDSELKVDRFVFDPANDNMSFLVNMSRGTAVYLSGQMAKLAPEDVKFSTPLSTIGIRGTRFLVEVKGK